ncbi:DEAD/DEAH box helicase (plasmid) [Fulvitalea axinellae]|uniref:DEAD/DEAH box helicase n=1 Tax=Fulvitalea axinellae TaxID=1182444 RepID=A0AAU9CXM4_9BACT|nr:DEAD/DEAH box helicase [Fulvitalea axinellae]
MKFEDYRLCSELTDNLRRLGFRKPTDIQYKSIPPVLDGDDVLAIAQTGTGKTAAFAIPVIDKLQYKKERQTRKDGIKCLVMVPTRELAMQITGVFEELSRGTLVNTFCLHGGVEQEKQIVKLQKGVDILVTTPGRMFDLISQKHLDLHRVDTLILDEADHMLALGFIKDIKDVIRHIPKKRQTLFYSATINETIKELAYSIVYKPVRIQISPKDPVARNISHSVAFIEMDDKRFFLERLVRENPDRKILVFVRTKVRAERVLKAMGRVGIEAMTIHGGKDQEERFETMKKFRSGENKVLIATDVSARGIDIPGVEYVVNYDLPEEPENYVHRVGRTGRGKEKGLAVSFCSEEEKPTLKIIESFLRNPVKELEIKKDDYGATLDFSEEKPNDWKALMREQEKMEKQAKTEGKKKKKRKKKK